VALTAKQLEMRRTGIGGSECGIVAGLAPEHWDTDALDVYLGKVQERPRKESEGMWLGSAMEPILAERYRLDHPGVQVRRNGRTFQHKKHKWMLATPDGFAVPQDGERYGLEFKVVLSYDESKMWGESGDEVPHVYLCQVQWYMEVLGLDRWDFQAFVAPFRQNRFRVYTIERSQALIDKLIELCGAFWHENIVKRTPPEPSGKNASRAALQALYEQDNGIEMPADMEMLDIGDTLIGADDSLRAAKADVELLQQRLKARMGDVTKVVGDGWNATWRTDKRGRRNFRFIPKGG